MIRINFDISTGKYDVTRINKTEYIKSYKIDCNSESEALLLVNTNKLIPDKEIITEEEEITITKRNENEY